MKKSYPLLPLLLCFCFTVSIHAKNNNAEKCFRKGKRALDAYDYLTAKPWLKEAAILDPDNARYNFLYGKCLFESSSQRESLPYFLRALQFDPAVDPELYYYVGRSLHLNGQYEDAIPFYEQDVSRYDDITEPRYNQSLVCIDQCKTAIKLMEKATYYKIENLGDNVNTRWPEYASTFADEYHYMLFTTRRPNNPFKAMYGMYMMDDVGEQVYSARSNDSMWAKTDRFRNKVNVFTHDASVSLSEDGNTLIYFVDRNYGDIFVSKNEDGKWTKKESIGEQINTNKFTEPSIFISDFGQSLYYVTNKPGGQGQRDIYVSMKDDKGKWGDGTNLGAMINTDYDEDAPFLSEDGKTLYFASNGPGSVGGFDIFKCEKNPDGTWTKPENMGFPVNSPGDDIFFFQRNDGNGFYLSSDRPGGFGDMDIYSGYLSFANEDAKKTMVNGKILNSENNLPLEAEVTLINPKTNEIIDTKKTTTTDGDYSFQIPKAGVDYKLDVVVKAGTKTVVENVKPKTGKINIVAGTVRDAITGLPLNAQVVLLDAGTGNPIDQSASNSASGQYMMPLTSGTNYILKVQSNEYLTYYEEFHLKSTDTFEPHYIDVGLQKTTGGNRIVINWQFFNSDQSAINAENISELDNLAEVMKKATDIKVKLVGHCDWDGSDTYNEALALKRATSVADYLVKKGISRNRMEISGRGEKEPLFNNSIPKMKKWNRRVEIFLLN